ncbi:MAG: hypothetical protein LBB90_09265 [Tannerella sp.]|jgi:hypothetical protein|nr:hypothetical protein [Tannerella sp.]
MKPLVLSFFAVILCYSLFFNEKGIQIHVDEVNYTIQTEYETYEVPDTLLFYARAPEVRGEYCFIPLHVQFAIFD